MKKKHTIIISCVVVVGIVISGLAFADGRGKGYRHGYGSKKHNKSGGLMLLAKYQYKNLKAQVLAEMTGQPVEAIQDMFQGRRGYSVMQELNVDRQAFRDAMQVKIREQVKKAVADGSITPDQEKEILEKMENRSKKRELMSRLVEKGVADGTISQEEAQMLMRKKR